MQAPASALGQSPLPPPPPPGPPMSLERPDAPFILSVLGGVFITLAGGVEVYYGTMSAPVPFGIGGTTYLAFGALGCGLGILVLILGSMLLARPERRVELGIAITVLSVLSVMSFWGGFILGLALGVIGGVTAIAWRPRPVMPPWPGWQVPAYRTCLHCGRFLSFDMRVCPYCATPVP